MSPLPVICPLSSSPQYLDSPSLVVCGEWVGNVALCVFRQSRWWLGDDNGVPSTWGPRPAGSANQLQQKRAPSALQGLQECKCNLKHTRPRVDECNARSNMETSCFLCTQHTKRFSFFSFTTIVLISVNKNIITPLIIQRPPGLCSNPSEAKSNPTLM